MKLNHFLALVAASSFMLLSACENHKTSQTTAAEETMGAKSDAVKKASKAKEITDANFAEITKSGVVLVDFWATWCPPCRKQGPIVDDVAGKVADIATVGKLDVDKNPKTANAYGVQSIPTLIIFKDGKKVKQLVGLTQADELVAAIKKAAGK